ncbi:hypothetical protein SNK03_13555 [Fusarium graminearum]
MWGFQSRGFALSVIWPLALAVSSRILIVLSRPDILIRHGFFQAQACPPNVSKSKFNC